MLCIVRTDAGNEHSYLIEYLSHGECAPRRVVLPQALLLASRGEEALKMLRALGGSVLYRNVKLVRQYLDEEHMRFSLETPDSFWRSVKVVGWTPALDCFVLPTQIIGNGARVWFSGQGDSGLYQKTGDICAWQTGIAAPCQGNSYLAFGLCCGLAGPLLEPLNIPGIGFHYHGESTIGKSTALALASSVWGSSKYTLAWSATVNGLEIQAINRSSTLIALDESHMVAPKVLDASVYLLLNGVSKARMTKEISAREVTRWRACVLSSGERSIETHLGVAHIDHKVGQGIRIIDVPIALSQYGLFTDLHGARTGSVFADTLRASAAKHYGCAGPSFVELLINNLGAGLSLSTRLEEVTPKFGNDLSAQEERVARAFALVGLAGELAIEWNILPWAAGEAREAAVEIFAQWRRSQPRSSKGKEYAQILEGVRNFIEVREADFSDADWAPDYDPNSGRIINPEPVIRERAGYWKEIAGQRLYLFNAEGLKRASSGFGARKALEVLEVQGALIDKDQNRRTKKIWIPHLKRSLDFYVIDPEKLQLL